MVLVHIVRLFPLWALLGCAVAVLYPGWFVSFEPAIVPLLGIVMFGMGMTLTTENFRNVLRRPLWVGLGVTLQFGLMPAIGWLLASLFGLAPLTAAGVVLLGSCPGGTASNVVCHLARGDVALSITITAVSTLLAVFATPLLTWLYVGQTVPVPVADMLFGIVKIVLVPVAAGVWVNHQFGDRLRRAKHFFPLVSVVAIVVIIAIIVALNEPRLQVLAGTLAMTVILHNLLGLVAGYGTARLLGAPVIQARTLAIETGMQNSGLAVALAGKYFSAAAALPGALFSIWHNVSGALLAGYWRRRVERGRP